MKAALYARLSDKDDPVSLEDQLQRGRTYAKDHGWEVVGEYIEPKRSGFHNKLAARPQGGRLLDDIEAGRVDVVIVRHTDRLSRRTVDVLTIREGCHIATTDQGIDTTRGDRLALGVSAVLAEEESSVKSDRQRAYRQREAARGRPRIGGPRMYGFEPDNLTPREEEQAIIRGSARLLASGSSLRAVRKLWYDSGVRNSKDAMVRQNVIRQVLLRAERYGVDEDVARRVRAILEDPNRQHNREGANRRRFVLNGLVFCAGPDCGRPMYGTRATRARVPYYRCSSPDGGCGMTSIQADHVEAEVWRQVEIERAFVTGDGFKPLANGEDAALREQLATLDARAANKRRDYADDLIDARTLKDALAVIDIGTAKVRGQLAELARTEAARESVRDWIERVSAGPEDFDQVRVVTRAAIDRILVRKTGKRGRRVQVHERITIEWAAGRGFPQVVEFTTADGDKVFMDPAALVRARATVARAERDAS